MIYKLFLRGLTGDSLKYFAYMSSFFPKSNMDELRGLLGTVSVIHQMINLYIIEAPDVDIEATMRRKQPVLLYRLFKLYSDKKVDEANYLDDIYNTVLKAGVPPGRIKLECFDWNSRRGHSAKDIEVAVGKRLEREGWDINIVKPKTLAYVVIADMHCYVGFTKFKDTLFLNPLRHYQKLASGISRAELKLIEAFDAFGIKAKKGIALDLGAAPGGWSAYLAKRGFDVVAVDNAALNYEKIGAIGLTVKSIDNTSGIGGFVGRYDILHVKSGFQKVAATLRDVELIASDMNIEPKEAIAAVVQFEGCLKKGAAVIITIKCITRNFPKFIKQARTLLPESFEVRGLKVLPNNRQEATLYAVKK